MYTYAYKQIGKAGTEMAVETWKGKKGKWDSYDIGDKRGRERERAIQNVSTLAMSQLGFYNFLSSSLCRTTNKTITTLDTFCTLVQLQCMEEKSESSLDS